MAEGEGPRRGGSEDYEGKRRGNRNYSRKFVVGGRWWRERSRRMPRDSREHPSEGTPAAEFRSLWSLCPPRASQGVNHRCSVSVLRTAGGPAPSASRDRRDSGVRGVHWGTMDGAWCVLLGSFHRPLTTARWASVPGSVKCGVRGESKREAVRSRPARSRNTAASSNGFRIPFPPPAPLSQVPPTERLFSRDEPDETPKDQPLAIGPRRP